MEDSKTLLDEEIVMLLNDMANMEAGSDEKRRAVENLDRLYKLKIEEQRAQSEDDDKYVTRVLKETEQKNQTILQWVKIGVEATIGLGGLVIGAINYHKGLKFEENGTVTSTFFKSIIGKKPGK